MLDTIEGVIKGILLGSIVLLFACYGPIVWNVDLPDYTEFDQAIDKIDWYCGNAFVFEQRCHIVKLHPIATVFIPNNLEFVSEL